MQEETNLSMQVLLNLPLKHVKCNILIVLHANDYIQDVKQILYIKTAQQTFTVKLNGLTTLRCCRQITSVNNSCNIHLILVFCTRGSHKQSDGNIKKSEKDFTLINTLWNNLTHRFFLAGVSCWWKATENPNKEPGSPCLCSTFSVSRLKAATFRIWQCQTVHRHNTLQCLDMILYFRNK